MFVVVGESFGLSRDELDVGSERLGSQAELDKLFAVLAHCSYVGDRRATNLFLLHELRIWTVVDNVCAKHRRGQRTVDLLRVDILQFSIKDKVVSFRTKADCGFLAQQDESEDITVLLPAFEEELVRFHSISDGAADERDPVEDQRWIGTVPAHRNDLS